MSSGSNSDDQNINLTLSFSKAPFSTVRAFSTSPETYNDKKNLITKLPINFNHKVFSLSNMVAAAGEKPTATGLENKSLGLR